MQPVSLPDRAFVTVSGQDAQDFLQALITTDLDKLTDNEALPGALLTPQGKILFDFVVTRDDQAIRLETGADQGEALLKRLTMYKLRAPITLSLTSPASVEIRFSEANGGFSDTRFAKAGQSVWRVYGSVTETTGTEDYDRLRIASGVAVSGADYALQDAFPHDVLMDKNGGLSFKKGCYVGQEVVSRMQHRGTARRRVVTVTSDSTLPETGTPLTVNGRLIGVLGTAIGGTGLAIVRTDKAGGAIAAGEPILAGDVAVTLALPAWTGLEFPSEADEATA
ncbi:MULTISPECIES: YgfZ/GcvT domain-containing protein [unclassified Rhizobium]|uniref:CAF17-like 4Fe-4S cluster assembly/insertion protein YgfZ n=1 Tax=unclassified Rhizobium TaxID=2613769 RepID=UPI0007138651|nr:MULTISPECIES: folate-binding protein YgfZ [unclassified Rhizobium]KQS96580.1 aminomethyltransferase [Rhizobium sp. Leaf386]KQT06418.1 aminomethyltransferase [Rhizobium sp. Leaf391]KQT92489.1 aminomethyltransferase [Rhizobium sp. Leaf453]